MEYTKEPAESAITPEELVVIAELAIRGHIDPEAYFQTETKAAARRIAGYLQDEIEVPQPIQALIESSRNLAQSQFDYDSERRLRRQLSGPINRFDVR